MMNLQDRTLAHSCFAFCDLICVKMEVLEKSYTPDTMCKDAVHNGEIISILDCLKDKI